VFHINPLPPQLSPALVEKLKRAEPATIGHFRDWGFMDPGIKALQQDVRIAGPAVTLHQPGVDGTIMGYALGQVRPGDVLVVDRCGDMRHAGFGGLVCYAAKVAKVAGVIIDGMVADVAEIRQYGVPVWCRGLSAITTKRVGLGGSFCAPISCGGVSVRPGDVIIADEVGVVVLAPGDAEAAAERAIQMQDDEVGKRARLDAGEKLPDISGASKVLAEALAKQKA
jgi:4-hydroxy-4-methyl-2-oxoglutarate aldolase